MASARLPCLLALESHRRGGRPRIHGEIRALIGAWAEIKAVMGAPRIHAELLMLGIEVAESTVADTSRGGRQPPS